MKLRSATALGASLLALALPTAAPASTLGGLTDNLGSAKVEAKVQIDGPVDIGATARSKAKAGRLEARQQVAARDDARLETAVRTHAAPSNARLDLESRVDRGASRELTRRSEAVRDLGVRSHRAKAKAARKGKRLVHAERRRTKRLVHRSVGAAGQAKQRTGGHFALADRGHGEPLGGIGREVGNPLQTGLAGGLLLGLACLAASVVRAGLRRSLR